ncbi:sialin [Caerostris darwini]|uniref:Sialin n=1 Tax=Caerostris darwini TaxID=1538125 RepID=A0AAV4VU95_9ARAC|nr:sialin [Caerostris darwini]
MRICFPKNPPGRHWIWLLAALTQWKLLVFGFGPVLSYVIGRGICMVERNARKVVLRSFLLWLLLLSDSWWKTCRSVQRQVGVRYQHVDRYTDSPHPLAARLGVEYPIAIRALEGLAQVCSGVCGLSCGSTLVTGFSFNSSTHFQRRTKIHHIKPESEPHSKKWLLFILASCDTDDCWFNCFFCGGLSDSKRNFSLTFVRKFCNSVSGFGSALGLVGVCLAGCDVALNKFFFILSIAIVGFAYCGHALSLLDMAPEFVGRFLDNLNT